MASRSNRGTLDVSLASPIKSDWHTWKLNTSVDDEFFYAFFSVPTGKCQLFWVRNYTDRKIQKRTEKLHYFSVRDNTHGKKINTHRKIVTIMSIL
jgi:hypothetical protein